MEEIGTGCDERLIHLSTFSRPIFFSLLEPVSIPYENCMNYYWKKNLFMYVSLTDIYLHSRLSNFYHRFEGPQAAAR